MIMILLTDEQLAFCRQCGFDPTGLDLTIMDRLFENLIEANRRTNLTRITSREEFWNLHVLDSLSVGIAAPELMTGSPRVADVGCGAGFPLLPLAWANPKLDITGIESRGKKTEFIQSQVEALDLTNVRVMNAQVREAARRDEVKEQFDVVLLRAVGQAGRMLRECRCLLKPAPQSKMIFYKTPTAIETELPEAQREADKFRLQLIESLPFHLPFNAGERQFLIFKYTK
ncbi:MAG: 16S rRNA (guanine(527)-N(7))-methyltransferase RsmG [Phycisphaerae bacterium]|nr:16S rRNA (guanine(527)-N(7))-methyltransferase RsmG [Phycisphaerae bacterium]